MSVSNSPTVVVAPPDFVRKDARYMVTWPTGEVERFTVADTNPGGWVEVRQPESRQRWINLSAARSIEQLR